MVGSLVRFLFTCCEESKTHSFAALTRSFAILHNSWIKIVRAYQPWSNLYILSSTQLVFSCSPHSDSCDRLSQHVCGLFLLPSTVCFAPVAQVLIVHILRTTPERWSTLIVCQNTFVYWIWKILLRFHYGGISIAEHLWTQAWLKAINTLVVSGRKCCSLEK